jgi:hypothetical protein
MLPLESVDADQTVIINMDVIDSVSCWRTLHASTEKPKIMNFVWWNTSKFTATVELCELALSAALFPTFANSERTARAIREAVKRLTVKHIAERARIGGVNLGIRLEHVQPRQEPDIPVILYPAIYMSTRKQPQLFMDVVQKIAKRTSVRVEARLVESALASRLAMQLAHQRWAWVGPLTQSRAQYWEALAHTTAFLATAQDESYGLEYIEALTAGAIGVFPDRDWARAILPPSYPFFYSTPAQAEALLLRAVTDTEACRAELDEAAGGSFTHWLRDHHDDDTFETAIVADIRRWFGPDIASIDDPA